MNFLVPYIFFILLCASMHANAQGVPEADGKIHYRHELRVRNPLITAFSPEEQQQIKSSFAKAYVKAKRPRILVLINERLLEGIEDPFEVDSKSEISVKMEGVLPRGNSQQQGNINIDIGDDSVNESGTVTVDGEITATQKTFRKKPVKNPGMFLDESLKAEIEQILVEPFLESGTLIVDKGLLVDTNFDALVPRLLSHKEGEKESKTIQSILKKSDLVLEFAIGWEKKKVLQVSGDSEIYSPKGNIRVLDLSNSRLLCVATTRDLQNKQSSPRLNPPFADLETEEIRNLVFDIMRKLTQRWEK